MKMTVMLLVMMMLISFTFSSKSDAIPSKNWWKDENGDIFDDWSVARTRSFGEDGFFQITENSFRPIIAFESLGENANIAYELGEKFREDYPDKHQRAEEIFYFVRDKVAYTSDKTLFEVEEFAQNADELAETIVEKSFAKGDCEDMAVLLAVMYKGAGYRSAIVLAPGHAATLVYLPEYDKANVIFQFHGEDGWIWAEATGKTNILGWAPQEVLNEDLAAYEVAAEPITFEKPPPESVPSEQPQAGNVPLQMSPLFLVIMFLWLISLFRRR